MSMLFDAQSWLADQLATHMSVSVVYSRDRFKSVTLNAVPGRPDGQLREPGSAGRVRLDDERLDFHIRPEEIDFGAGPVDPQSGDRLEVGGLIREVFAGDSLPAWARSDVFGEMIRVRTRLEGVA